MWFGFLDDGASSHRASTDIENRNQNKRKSRPTYSFRVGFAPRFPVFERWKTLSTLDRGTILRMSVECTCKKLMARNYATKTREYETLFLNMWQGWKDRRMGILKKCTHCPNERETWGVNIWDDRTSINTFISSFKMQYFKKKILYSRPWQLNFEKSLNDDDYGLSYSDFFLTFCWPCISVFNQLDAQNCFTISFISCLYQRLCNAILTSWWWAHVLETCRGMK